MDWYLKVLRNYVGFGGRARRKEYWMFVLVNFVLIMVLGIVDKILGWEREGGEGILTTIYGVLVLLPSWAVLFRRLHDTDRSAWWLLLLEKTSLVRIRRSAHKKKPGGASLTGPTNYDFIYYIA